MEEAESDRRRPRDPHVARWLAAYALLALVLFFVFGRHTYHPTDHGFILAGAWRVVGGQVPHRDFFSPRPPGSLYLHALEILLLPDQWSLLASRLCFYVQMAVSSALPALLAIRAGLAPAANRLLLLSLCFYLIALRAFPVMPWHTVDGVFLGTLGLCATWQSLAPGTRRPVRWRALASVAFVAAALCKQPFAALPAALVLLALCEPWLDDAPRSPRAHLLAASFVPGALLLVSFVGYLASEGALAGFVDQVGRNATYEELVTAGFTSYLQSGAWTAAFAGLGLAWLRFSADGKGQGAESRGWRSTAVVLGVYAAVAALAWRAEHAAQPLFFLVLGSLAGRLLFERRDTQRTAGAPARTGLLRLLCPLGVLLLGWCASISWGVPSPGLGLAAAAVAVDPLLPRVEGRLQRALGGAVLVVALSSVGWLNFFHPYRDVPLPEQTAALHHVFPRFGNLYTHPEQVDRFVELALLIDRYASSPERPFTVLTGYPLVHFLTARQSPTLLDWYLPLEVRRHRERHVEALLGFDGVIFFHREAFVGQDPRAAEPPGPCRARDFDFSPELAAKVFRAGRLLASTRDFCVVEMDGRTR